MKSPYEKLLIPQPALSNTVQKIEHEYGAKIFVRDLTARLVLTAVDQQFIEQAAQMIASADEFEEVLRKI